jgi:hypothetical protein
MTCSIDELLDAGVILEADEAVAIAQQLIAALRDPHQTDEVQPPYGPPSTDNVFLKEDGTVFCRSCQATPVVSEIGSFLDSLLPEGSPRVPGGVRYTIARALLNVDVPPFGSLDELSRALARHELGDRDAAVRRVLARYGSVSTPAVITSVDRRRHHASVTDLRRALREADARLYERERLLPRDLVIDVLPQPQPATRDHTRLMAAACLAAGLALVSMSELIHKGQSPSVATKSAPIVESTTAPEEPRIEPAAVVASPAHGIIAVRDVPTSRVRAARQEPQRMSQKRASGSQAGPGGRTDKRLADPGQRRRGVLDRLRLGWLRSVL